MYCIMRGMEPLIAFLGLWELVLTHYEGHGATYIAFLGLWELVLNWFIMLK